MICHICSKPATFVCPVCLRGACNEHYRNSKFGIGCSSCIDPKLAEYESHLDQIRCHKCGTKGDSNNSVSKCPHCGRYICQKCGYIEPWTESDGSGQKPTWCSLDEFNQHHKEIREGWRRHEQEFNEQQRKARRKHWWQF